MDFGSFHTAMLYILLTFLELVKKQNHGFNMIDFWICDQCFLKQEKGSYQVLKGI